MPYSSLRFRMVGVAPLLMRSAVLSDPLHPLARGIREIVGKRLKTEADHLKIAELEWHANLWIADGRLVIPADVIMAAFVNGAKTRRLGRQARAGLICPQHCMLQYHGPSSIDELWNDNSFRFRAPVRVQQAITIRTRPIIHDWQTEVELHFLPTLLNKRDVIEILRLTGEQIAIGDWRPKFGRFEASEV